LGRVALPVFLAFDLFSGKNIITAKVKDVTFYVMGSTDSGIGDKNGNYWTTLEDWPDYTPTKLFLQEGGALSFDSSTIGEPDSTTSFIFDPTDPVPTEGGNNLELSCGPKDQRKVEKHPAVIIFTSGELTETLALTGPLDVMLYVSSNATDTDFTAKLTDVYPDNSSMLIQDGGIRMRWREYSVMKLMEPGTVYEVRVSLWNTSYVFTPGHKIRLAISSSNYPRYSVNPNNGLPLTESGPNITAANKVHHSADTYPSHIVLPVVQMSQIPPFPVWEYPQYFTDEYVARKYLKPVLATKNIDFPI